MPNRFPKMVWCRLATGAVGVIKMAFGATYGCLASYESTVSDILLCSGGAATSTIWGVTVTAMALCPNYFRQYDEQKKVVLVRHKGNFLVLNEDMDELVVLRHGDFILMPEQLIFQKDQQNWDSVSQRRVFTEEQLKLIIRSREQGFSIRDILYLILESDQASLSAPHQEAGPSGPHQEAGPSGPHQEAGPSGPQQEAGPSGPQQEAGPSGPQQEALMMRLLLSGREA